MPIELVNALYRIADELHTMNVLNAERNAVLEYCIPSEVVCSRDLLPKTREYLEKHYKERR